MRASDFLLEDDEPSDQYANIVTVLELVQEKIRSGELSDELPTQFIIRLIQNTGISNFNYTDLIGANEANKSMKNIVKNLFDKNGVRVYEEVLHELNLPVFVAEATGRLKVCVSPVEAIAKLVPAVPVVKNCDWSVKLFKETIPLLSPYYLQILQVLNCSSLYQLAIKPCIHQEAKLHLIHKPLTQWHKNIVCHLADDVLRPISKVNNLSISSLCRWKIIIYKEVIT